MDGNYIILNGNHNTVCAFERFVSNSNVRRKHLNPNLPF